MLRIFSEYGRVFDVLPEMILILDEHGIIRDCNVTAAQSLSLNVSSHPSVKSILPEDCCGEFLRLLRAKKDITSVETKFISPDSSTIEISMDLKLLDSAEGTFTVVVARDITNQKQKDLDFLRFSNVIHYTINPIQITDANGMMVYVNPAFEKASGYKKAELIGKNPKILRSGKHDTEFWKEVWSQILSGRMWVGKLENQRKDGTQFHTELVISPIVDESGTVAGFLGAHRDITEQKMLEQQLVRSQRMESIGTLAAGIAHEVGNPLTAISSLVQVLQRTTSDTFAKEKLELINSQITRITRIIRELVDFSRPTTHTVKDVNLNQTMLDALSIVQYGSRGKEVTFSVRLADGLPTVRAVADQMIQVFINILMNAIDSFAGKTGVVTIESRFDAGFVEARVHDTGKGIPSEGVEKIFEPFYTTKAVGQGTGLGLWVSYGIVKSFGGDIQVESTPGVGSTMRVLFPHRGA